MKKSFHIVLILLHSFMFSTLAQKSRTILEKEKKANLAKIIQTKKILNETQKERENTVGQIKAIIQQIENQENSISLAREDIELIKGEMSELVKAQNELTNQLKALQIEYAQTLYRSSKNSNKLTKLGFLFSSGSLNELFMRYKYLEQYTESRKHQLVQINKIGEMLKQRQRTLLEKKIKQQAIIESIKIESKNLEVLKERQGLIVADLTLKEGALKEEMEKSKTAVRNLNNLISRIIEKDQLNRKIPASRRESIKEREEAEKKMLSKKNENSVKNVEKESALATTDENTSSKSSKRNFASFKSKLAWPAEGFISDKFGVKNHPVLKGLKVDNNGIDIQTSPNAAVHAVFEGTVLDISQIPGLNNVVAIQHGEFYTVYANLNTINVSINDKVNMNQTLGTVATKDGSPEINFQIWHNFDKLNPEPWLENK